MKHLELGGHKTSRVHFSREGHFDMRWIKECIKLYSVENIVNSDG